MLLMLLACTKATPETPDVVVDVDTPATEAPADGPTAPDVDAEQLPRLAGSWTSAECGDRTYQRILTLQADGTYEMVDLVSPCPPGVQCIWSGIITSSGTWEALGPSANLVETKTDANDQGAARPSELRILRNGHPAEDWGEGQCMYEVNMGRVGMPVPKAQ